MTLIVFFLTTSNHNLILREKIIPKGPLAPAPRSCKSGEVYKACRTRNLFLNLQLVCELIDYSNKNVAPWSQGLYAGAPIGARCGGT